MTKNIASSSMQKKCARSKSYSLWYHSRTYRLSLYHESPLASSDKKSIRSHIRAKSQSLSRKNHRRIECHVTTKDEVSGVEVPPGPDGFSLQNPMMAFQSYPMGPANGIFPPPRPPRLTRPAPTRPPTGVGVSAMPK